MSKNKLFAAYKFEGYTEQIQKGIVVLKYPPQISKSLYLENMENKKELFPNITDLIPYFVTPFEEIPLVPNASRKLQDMWYGYCVFDQNLRRFDQKMIPESILEEGKYPNLVKTNQKVPALSDQIEELFNKRN